MVVTSNTPDIKIEIHLNLEIQYLVTVLGQTREHFALNQHLFMWICIDITY